MCECGDIFKNPAALNKHCAPLRKGAGHAPQPFTLRGQPALNFGPYLLRGNWVDRLDRVLQGESPGTAKPSDPPHDEGAGEGRSEAKDLLFPKGEAAKGSQLRVQVRPQVYDVPEDLLYLYNMDLAAYMRLGVAYSPTFGQWARDWIFRAHIEHPEVLDLSSIFTPEELDYVKQEYARYATAPAR